MRTSAILSLATLGVVLTGTAANAAPAEPEFPLKSVCTLIEPIGELPRKSCQLFDSVTGDLVGDPQVYTYPPENNLEAPVIAPYTPRAPYVAPAGNDETNDSAPLPTRPTPVVPAPRTPAPVDAAGPTAAPTAEPAPIDASPRTPSPGRPAADGGLLEMADDHAPAVALLAFVILVIALAWRPRTR